LRDEFLNAELLFSLADAQSKLAQWREDFNHARPYSAFSGQHLTQITRQLPLGSSRPCRPGYCARLSASSFRRQAGFLLPAGPAHPISAQLIPDSAKHTIQVSATVVRKSGISQ
jgi:hypothetical protein